MDISQPDPKILAIVKALAYTENGGKPTEAKVGGSGEVKSIFQFMPDTWKMYSKQVFGKEMPISPELESVVVYKKVQNWINEGHDVNQIASMWNAGEQKPDAYKYLKGTNSKGVKYDTPAYAKKVSEYTKQFENERGINTSKTGKEAPTMAVKQTQKTQSSQNQTLPQLMAQQNQVQQPQMKQVKQV